MDFHNNGCLLVCLTFFLEWHISFIFQPYKREWMSNFDGWTLSLAGMLMLLDFINKAVFMIGGVAGLSTMVLLFIFVVYHKYKGLRNVHSVNQNSLQA